MAAAYSIRCPACGLDFLSTHTQPATITSCPHCAHNAPLQSFLGAGVTAIGSAPALPVRRREITAKASPPPDFPTVPPLPVPHQPEPAPRPVPTNVTFLPAESWSSTSAPPPRRRTSRTRIVILACLPLIAVAAAWLLLKQPSASVTSASSPAALPPAAVAAEAPEPVKIKEAIPVATAPTPAPTPSQDEEAETDRLSIEAPVVLQALFESPPQDRPPHVLGGKRHAESLERFFSRPGLALSGPLKLLPFIPIDLPTGRPGVLFQAATTANTRGVLACFQRGDDDALRLDWPLFHESHDELLEQFLASEEDEPRWFHVCARRSHGLDLREDFRETHLTFDLQTSLDSKINAPGIVARNLPVGRFLQQATDWQVIYLARLLLLKKTLPDGRLALEILDCEGAGVSRPSQTALPAAR